MKVAIATENKAVYQHFRHCPEYTIYAIEKDNIRQKIIHNPGHRPNFLPRYLPEQGVDVIIAGGMDVKAQKLFGKLGIEACLAWQGPLSLSLGNMFREHYSKA
jgi:predicted Fe-Mo cluster-binding NifX family protein